MTKHEKLDPWRDLMVAALYDELGPQQREELEERMATDDTLRRDWEELLAARAALAELSGENEGEAPAAVVGSGVGWSAPAPPRGRWMVPAAAGFAAAAVLFLGLLLAGLRVDRTPAGLLVRLDGSPAAELEAAGGVRSPAGVPSVTRTDVAELGQVLLASTAARLDELERRQAGAQVELTQALYDALAQRQQRQFDDLRSRIELVRAGERWPAAGSELPVTRKGEHHESY